MMRESKRLKMMMIQRVSKCVRDDYDGTSLCLGGLWLRGLHFLGGWSLCKVERRREIEISMMIARDR